MPLPPDILEGLARRLGEYAGLELPAWVIETRAQARIGALGVTAADYLALVDSARGAGELAELIELVRVGETRFFRHLPQVEALSALLPPSLRPRVKRTVRVWSAGCATGEEPYTLALVLSRLLPGHDVSILATDVSADALEVARAATYPLAALDRVPAAYRDGFEIAGAQIHVRPEITSLVSFEQKNLADDARHRGFDLVWCRNVLIYFAAPARRRVVDRLIAALEPGGFLFVGYSETLRDVGELEAVRTGEAVAYVRKVTTTPSRAGAGPATKESGAPGASVDFREVTPAPVLRRTPVTGVPITTTPAAGSARGRTTTPLAVPIVAPERRLAIASPCDPAALTRELTTLLAAPGLRRLTIDLDAADFVPDEVAPILRRARAAARAAGLELVVSASRAGAQRWLRRHGLEETP